MGPGLPTQMLETDIEVTGTTRYRRSMGRLADATAAVGEQASATRTSLLFLSFGMLAAGGLMSRAGMALSNVLDRMRDSFAGVEQRAVVVGTIMGATAQETTRLQNKMLELGRATEFTAQQAGDAMTRLAMAGLNVEETTGAVAGTLKLATIGMVDTTTAADLAVGVLRGFNMNTENAAETAGSMTVVVSALAQAATHSATTIDQMADALKFVAATAESANIRMEESVAVLMLAADNMIRAGIAGRALRMSLIRLQTAAGGIAEQTKGTQEMLAVLGVELVDETGNVKDLAMIVDELNFAFREMETAEKNAALAAIFGARAVTMWSALLREGGDAIRERELGLTAAASKEAIFNRFTEDSTELLIKWKQQVEDTNVDVDDLRKQLDAMGFSFEEADAIIRTITSDLEDASAIIEDAALASEVTRQRLETLHGTAILFQSSLEALYASLSQEILPIFLWWNKVLRRVADVISGWPGPIKALIAVLVLLTFIITTLGGRILLTLGSIVMISAAITLLNKQMGTSFTASQLMAMGLKQVGRTALGTASAVGVLTLRVVILGGAIGASAVIFRFALEQWEKGNHVLAVLAGIIGALIPIYTAYMLIRKTELWVTIRQIFLTWGLTKAYIAQKLGLTGLTWATVRQTWATKGLAIAQKALPLIGLVMAFAALTQGMEFAAAGLLIITLATWAWNASLYANPLVWIIGVIAGFIFLLIELIRNIEKVADAFRGAWDWLFGSPDTIFDHMAWGADDARRSIAGLGAELRSTNEQFRRTAGMSDIVGGPQAPPVTRIQERRNQVVNPRTTINMGGVRIAGPMQEEQLRDVVSQAADEANRRWAASFDAEAEEVPK